MKPVVSVWEFFDTKNPAHDERVLKVIISMAQELAAMRGMLEAAGVWNEAEFRRRRVERMVADHNAAGANPWSRRSYWRFVVDEEDALRQVFGADDAEVAAFRDQVDFVQQLT